MQVFQTLTNFSAHVGQELGATDWLLISQDMINRFAEATGDYQWIHTDPERAARESPYHVPIAHGFLTLSLAPKLMAQLYTITSVKMGVNYGANKVRFTNAVPAGSRIRMKARLQQIKPLPPQGIQAVIECTFELEGQAKPACVAELITLLYEG